MAQKMAKGTKSAYVEGALLLGLAAVISKVIGTMQKIPLQNIAGDGVFGIYNAVYPFYILIVFLATAGFPVAISSFVAERMERQDEAGARRVLWVSMGLLSIFGIMGFLALYGFAGVIAGWIGNRYTEAAIRSCSYALLVVPVMSALRGYFQGKANMLPTAVSQVAEQVIRVSFMLLLLWIFTSRGASESTLAAGATFGSTAGGIAGLIVLLLYYRQDRTDTAAAAQRVSTSADTWTIARQLLRYALFVCLGSIAVPMLSIVDTFTIPHLLAKQVDMELYVMREFGIYNRGLPLVQLVGMIVSSASVALIPSIATSMLRGEAGQVRTQIVMVLRWFWIIGWAATVGLVLLAKPINIALYKNDAGTITMAWVAGMAVMSTMNIVTGAALQGLGKIHAPAYHLFVAIIVKLLLNMWLIPRYGMSGAAVAGIAAYGAAALLNYIVLHRTLELRWSLRSAMVKPGLLIGMMAIAVAIISIGVDQGLALAGLPLTRLGALLLTLIGVLAGVLTLLFGMLRMGLVEAGELERVPKLAKMVTAWKRAGWLK